MTKSILIAVDGTPKSLAAVRAAVAEGPAAHARIDLANVQPGFNRHVSRFVARDARDAWRRERAAAALAPARRLVEAAGIPCTTHELRGAVAPALARLARELDSREILVGAAKRGLLGRFLANSATTRLLEAATVPVRVVPVSPAPALERLAWPASVGIGVALVALAAD